MRLFSSARVVGNVKIGKGTVLEEHVVISTKEGGWIRMGEDCTVRSYAHVQSHGGYVKIGDRVVVNSFDMLYGHGGLDIGNDVIFAPHVVVIPANHKFIDLTTPIRLQGHDALGIMIGDETWIGCNVSILDGIKIGNHCVIGAGSVVTRSIPSHSVAYGNPAKVRRVIG